MQRIQRNDKIVLFIGGPRHNAFQAILSNEYHVSHVFFPDNKNPKLHLSRLLATTHQIPYSFISKDQISNFSSFIKNKLCISLGFPYLFPTDFYQSAKLFINVHGTLLPKYRGGCTLNWVIENGDEESGVTVHLIDEGCDTGDIIIQKRFAVSKFDTGKSLYRKTLEFEPSVIIEALNLIMTGKYELQAQADRNIKQYPNRQPDHSEVNPEKTLLQLYNQIRASDPKDYPAYFLVDGEKVCITLWRANKPSNEEDTL